MPLTKQNCRVVCWHSEVPYATPVAVQPTAVMTNAYVTNQVTLDADSSSVVETPWKLVQFNLLDPALASTNIVAAGKTINYVQLGALMRQAVLDQANAKGIT